MSLIDKSFKVMTGLLSALAFATLIGLLCLFPINWWPPSDSGWERPADTKEGYDWKISPEVTVDADVEFVPDEPVIVRIEWPMNHEFSATVTELRMSGWTWYVEARDGSLVAIPNPGFWFYCKNWGCPNNLESSMPINEKALYVFSRAFTSPFFVLAIEERLRNTNSSFIFNCRLDFELQFGQRGHRNAWARSLASGTVSSVEGGETSWWYVMSMPDGRLRFRFSDASITEIIMKIDEDDVLGEINPTMSKDTVKFTGAVLYNLCCTNTVDSITPVLERLLKLSNLNFKIRDTYDEPGTFGCAATEPRFH